jgi:hypothetical protein
VVKTPARSFGMVEFILRFLSQKTSGAIFELKQRIPCRSYPGDEGGSELLGEKPMVFIVKFTGISAIGRPS